MKIILRIKNKDKEGDKYQYFRGCTDSGIEITTPFKREAKVINEGEEIKVVSKDWKAIKYERN